jgi:hypothetical protein
MTKKDIDRFFEEFAKRCARPIEIYLTGGIAAWFLGGNRPTRDIDFAVSDGSEEVARSLDQVSRELEIPIQYSDDIQRWGMINLPALYEGAALHKKFGSVAVYLLAPEKWAIGKLNRYLESDLEDLTNVFRKQKPELQKTLAYWRRALRESPASPQQSLFKHQVNHFLKNYGKSIWGEDCPEKLF